MARRRITHQTGRAAIATWQQAYAASEAAARNTTATAVRYLLEELAEQAPGNSVEVRVPPYGVTQCIEGPQHTRGTPANVVELDGMTWLTLATGERSWQQAQEEGLISASGVRADLSDQLPLL